MRTYLLVRVLDPANQIPHDLNMIQDAASVRVVNKTVAQSLQYHSDQHLVRRLGS